MAHTDKDVSWRYGGPTRRHSHGFVAYKRHLKTACRRIARAKADDSLRHGGQPNGRYTIERTPIDW